MTIRITNAMTLVEILGELGRFGKNQLNVCRVAGPEQSKQGKGTGATARFLARNVEFGGTKEWYKFLQAELSDDSFTLSQIYKLYEKFYQSDGAKKVIESDLICALKSSVKLIKLKAFDPIIIPKKKMITNGRAKISRNSLRGENRFVQMAVCNVNDINKLEFPNEYAYEMPVNERDAFDKLTASKDEIEGYGDSEKNLLAHMQNKNTNDFKEKGKKKAKKDLILFNESKIQEIPNYIM